MKQYAAGSFGLRALGAAALALSVSGAARAQQQPVQEAGKPAAQGAAKPSAQKPQAPKPQGLSVKESKDAPGTFDIVAKDAKLTELTAELQKLIKAPIFLSPVMQQQRVTVELAGASLESVTS